MTIDCSRHGDLPIYYPGEILIRLSIVLVEEEFSIERTPQTVDWGHYYETAEAELDKAYADAKMWLASRRNINEGEQQ